MRDYLTYIPLALIYFAFTGTIFTNIPVPDLTILLAFYLSYRKPSVQGVVLIFILGYIEDTVCGGIIGSSSAALTLLYATGFIFASRLEYSDPLTKTYVVFGASLIKASIVFTIVSLKIHEVVFEPMAVATAIISGLLAPMIIRFFDSIDKRLEIIFGKEERSL